MQVSPVSSVAAFGLVLVTGLALLGIFVCVARELRPLPADGPESRRDPSVVGRWVRAGLARRGRSAPQSGEIAGTGDVDKLAGPLDPQVSDAL
ncbi:MAG: hypothetical protein H0V45_15185 [Actinobacteria bacterium]|nr:hypothetical protein [Actinomycetota bacterium]